MFVPVVDQDQKPLMPTTPNRARRWIKSGKATPFFKKGVFCIRLNQQPSDNEKQEIALGIDPGSKKEGFTVKSKAHTFLNIQADAITWVNDRMKTRREMRRSRRNRNCPCRKPNCIQGRKLPPSTKARWQWKLNIIFWLKKIFPVSIIIVEDIKAISKKNQKKWNKSFNPLQVGKNWFYSQISNLILKQGYETKQLRDQLNLKKSKNKLSNDWSAHCIDSWVLANSIVGGDIVDNNKVLLISSIRLHRRQLHRFQPSKGGIRNRYGGTMSMGFKRGSLVKHEKYGLVYVGGNSNGKISLHSINNGERITERAKKQQCKFLSYNKTIYE